MNLRHLRKAVLSGCVLLCSLGCSNDLLAQDWPGHRVAIGDGAVVVAPDSAAGVVLWASRPARPGHRPTPDFVGWFAPQRVYQWNGSDALVALDGGIVSVLAISDSADTHLALAFGHPGERQRWLLEGSEAQIEALLATMRQTASISRLTVPPGLGYANPTNRRATPDRLPSPLPRFQGGAGEVWASAELDRGGGVIPGSIRVVWATRSELARAVEAVLPRYRYQRHDGGGPERLRVYQRFRAR